MVHKKNPHNFQIEGGGQYYFLKETHVWKIEISKNKKKIKEGIKK